jgi:serine/threonine protein kinase
MPFDSSEFTGDPTEGQSFRTISSYRLIHRLGAGGMGEVWLAERVSEGLHSQKVAIKYIDNAGTGITLDNEALRMSRLNHDNIVPFIDSGRDAQGRFFVAMAFIEGIDPNGIRLLAGLTSKAAYQGRATGRVPDLIVGFIMFMVLRALNYAHNFDFGGGVCGLIHRDVSPGNILISTGQGFIKLSDFGVAVRQSSLGPEKGISGKVPYMAPEVLMGEDVDVRSDLYALGLVAYELLTGFNPNIQPSGLSSVISAITAVMLALEQPLRPPHEVLEGVHPEISRIVTRLLCVEPAGRYQSAESVIADLVPCLYEPEVGPGSEALVAYFTLVGNLHLEPSARMRAILSFLLNPEGDLVVRPKWKLFEAAARDLAESGNPARVGD